MTKREVRCSLCSRADVAEINSALRARRPLRALEQKFRTSKSALDRHREHIAPPSPPPSSPAPPRELAMPPAGGLALGSPLPTRMTSDALIDTLEAIVQEQVIRLARNTDLSEVERSGLQKAAVTTLAHLAKLQGRTEISERRILASPAWRRLVEVMVEALSPWPQALGAVGATLEAAGEAQERS